MKVETDTSVHRRDSIATLRCPDGEVFISRTLFGGSISSIMGLSAFNDEDMHGVLLTVPKRRQGLLVLVELADPIRLTPILRCSLWRRAALFRPVVTTGRAYRRQWRQRRRRLTPVWARLIPISQSGVISGAQRQFMLRGGRIMRS